MVKGIRFTFALLIFVLISSFASATLTDDLQAWWNMNETSGTTIEDQHGGYNGSLTGATATSGGVEYFASSDYMSVNSLDLVVTEDYSVGGFFYIDSTGTGASERLLYTSQSSSNSQRLSIFISGTTLTARQEDDAGTNQDITISGLSTSANYMVIVNWDYSSGLFSMYLNNASSTSDTITKPTGSQTGGMIFGHNPGTSYGQMDGKTWSWGQWNRTLNSSERDFLYNGGVALKYDELVPVPPDNKRYESSFQAVQDDLVTITLDDTWTPIISGTTTFNNVTNYGSSTIQTLSTGSNTTVSCRTTIDGISQNDTNSRTNIPGEIGSINLLRQDFNESGTFDLEVECMKNGGTTFFNFTSGVAHVIDNTTYSFYDTVETNFTGTNQVLYTVPINSTYDGYIIFDWAGTIGSANAQTTYFQMNSSDWESCQLIPRDLAGGDEGSIGDSCSFEVLTGVQKNFTFYGTGNALDVNLKGHVKILSQANSTGISNINLTSTPTSVASVSINNTDRLDKIYMKAGIPLSDNGQQINFQFYVDGSAVGSVVPYTATTLTKESIQQFLADAPDKDSFNVELYAWKEVAGGNAVSIEGGNLIGYITKDYPVNLTSFTVTAINDWNGSSINEFSVFSGGVTYNTTDGSLEIFTQDELVNVTFSSNNYLDRTYINHNTSSSLQGELYQTIVTLTAETLAGNISVENFTLIGEFGTYATTNGTLIINPNYGNFLFNLTSPQYFGIDNYPINVTTTPSSFKIPGFYDSNLDITAEDYLTGSAITDFNGSISYGSEYYINFSTSNGTATLNTVKGINYNIMVGADNYFTNSFNRIVNLTSDAINVRLRALSNLRVNFIDEITLEPSYNVTFDIKSDVYSATFNLTGINTQTINDLPFSDIYEVRYSIGSTDYAPRSYFFSVPLTYNNESNLTLYTININESSLFQRFVFDQGSIPLSASIVEIQRPYTSDDFTGIMYKTVEMASIDDEGSAIFSAVPNTQAYRLRFLQNFTILETQTPTYFVDTISQIIVRTQPEVLENFKKVMGVSGNVYYQNTSSSFIFDYIGSGVGADEYCLEVTRRYGPITNVTQQCAPDETGTLIITINASEPGNYLANGYSIIGEVPYLIDSETFDPNRLNGKSAFGIWAVLILILGLLVAGTMGAFTDPKISIIFALLMIGSFGLYLLDLVAFSFIAMGGLIILGIVIMYLYEKTLRG